MTFDNALKLLRQGVALTRMKWEDSKQFVFLKDGLFRKEMKINCGKYEYNHLPYNFSSEDLLANDWEVTRQQITVK